MDLALPDLHAALVRFPIALRDVDRIGDPLPTVRRLSEELDRTVAPRR